MAGKYNQDSHPVMKFGAPAKHGKGMGASGKEQFKTTGGSMKSVAPSNAGGRKNQQAKGKGEKFSSPGTPDKSGNARAGLWKHTDSLQQGSNFPGA